MDKEIDNDGWTIIHQFGVWTIKKHPTEKDNLVIAGAVYGKRNVKRGGDYEYWWDIDRCNENWEEHLDYKDWWDDVRTECGPRYFGYKKELAKRPPNKRSDFIKCLTKAKEMIAPKQPVS